MLLHPSIRNWFTSRHFGGVDITFVRLKWHHATLALNCRIGFYTSFTTDLLCAWQLQPGHARRESCFEYFLPSIDKFYCPLHNHCNIFKTFTSELGALLSPCMPCRAFSLLSIVSKSFQIQIQEIGVWISKRWISQVLTDTLTVFQFKPRSKHSISSCNFDEQWPHFAIEFWLLWRPNALNSMGYV